MYASLLVHVRKKPLPGGNVNATRNIVFVASISRPFTLFFTENNCSIIISGLGTSVLETSGFYCFPMSRFELH